MFYALQLIELISREMHIMALLWDCHLHHCSTLSECKSIIFINAHRSYIYRELFNLYSYLDVFRYLKDENSVLLLYSLVHGNVDFLEYCLVRTDLDTLVFLILNIWFLLFSSCYFTLELFHLSTYLLVLDLN